jgi:hypothetical protein
MVAVVLVFLFIYVVARYAESCFRTTSFRIMRVLQIWLFVGCQGSSSLVFAVRLKWKLGVAHTTVSLKYGVQCVYPRHIPDRQWSLSTLYLRCFELWRTRLEGSILR